MSSYPAEPRKRDNRICRWRTLLLGVVEDRVDLEAQSLLYREITHEQQRIARVGSNERELGPLPYETLWFGAVGGWLISDHGIFLHNHKWENKYDYWHGVAPVLGALVGAFASLMVIVLVGTASKGAAKHASTALHDVIALAVGYREQTFGELVKKIVDTVIAPGQRNQGAAAEVPVRR